MRSTTAASRMIIILELVDTPPHTHTYCGSSCSGAGSIFLGRVIACIRFLSFCVACLHMHVAVRTSPLFFFPPCLLCQYRLARICVPTYLVVRTVIWNEARERFPVPVPAHVHGFTRPSIRVYYGSSAHTTPRMLLVLRCTDDDSFFHPSSKRSHSSIIYIRIL